MITEEKIAALRETVAARLSAYRMAHTLGVEDMVTKLAALYCPEKILLLRGAALLHDVTKELSDEEQLAILAAHGVVLRPDEAASPQVWHGMTAVLVIPEQYPAFADKELLSAVRWHTTGRAGMTLSDALLGLADCIEEGRKFEDCITLRKAFFDAVPEKMTGEERHRHLRNILLLSYEKTLSKLQEKGGEICLDSLAARNDLYHNMRLN